MKPGASLPLPPVREWPPEAKALFWDLDLAGVRPGRDRKFIIHRILCSGGLVPLRWLARFAPGGELRLHLRARSGRGVERRRLRYFGLWLGLPSREVSEWVKAQEDKPFPGKAGRAL